MADPATPPPWIAEGARVVSYAVGGAGTSPSVRLTTVAKVNPKTFALEGEDIRYPLPDPDATKAQSQRIGGTWGHVRVVVPYDSEEGQREVAAMRRRVARLKVDTAYTAWRKSRSADDLALLASTLEDPNL